MGSPLGWISYCPERSNKATSKVGAPVGSEGRTAALALAKGSLWTILSSLRAFSVPLRQFLPGLWDLASPALHASGTQNDGP